MGIIKHGGSMKKNKNGKIAIVIIMIVITIVLTSIITINVKGKKVVYKDRIIKQVEKKATIEEIKKKENILFLGDSITEIYPIDSIYNDLPVVKSGVSGFKTTDILDRMNDMVYQYNPTQVFLLIGTNDFRSNVDDETIRQTIKNIKKIISNIKENRKKAKIYLESIYPVNKKINTNNIIEARNNDLIKKINKELNEYCDENDITYINMYDELIDKDGNFNKDYTYDGLHPSTLGYAKITEILTKYIYGIEE